MILPDRPTPTKDEIEVTPEMIEAGALALSEYTSVFDTLEDGAEKIYRSMVAVHLERAKNHIIRG